MSEIGRLLRSVRRAVSPRDRTRPVGRVRYRCDLCQMSIAVMVCHGVVLPSRKGADDLRAPAPSHIQCAFCDEMMEIDESSYEAPIEIELESPYLRVPSRSAGAEMAAAGRIVGQLVVDDEH